MKLLLYFDPWNVTAFIDEPITWSFTTGPSSPTSPTTSAPDVAGYWSAQIHKSNRQQWPVTREVVKTVVQQWAPITPERQTRVRGFRMHLSLLGHRGELSYQLGSDFLRLAAIPVMSEVDVLQLLIDNAVPEHAGGVAFKP